MEVGVLDSKDLNETKLEYLTFPNYSDPAFTDTWIVTGDTVAIPVTELSNTGMINLSAINLPEDFICLQSSTKGSS